MTGVRAGPPSGERLTDALGRVVAQYSYAPYGDLLATERFVPDGSLASQEAYAAAGGNRLGH